MESGCGFVWEDVSLKICMQGTDSSHLKMDGWNTIVSLWEGRHVSSLEGNLLSSSHQQYITIQHSPQLSGCQRLPRSDQSNLPPGAAGIHH